MADYKRGKRRKKSRKSFRYLPVAAVLFAIALLIGISAFFRMSDIIVTGEQIYSEEEIIEASELEMGDNLLFFGESLVSDRIKSKLSYAGDVKIAVKYPSTVEIIMDESVAIASIISGGSCWIIDTEGKIVEQTNTNGTDNTITVTGIELTEPDIGKRIKSENSIKVMYLVDILQSIHDNDAIDKISKLDITSIANISFDYDGRFKVNFGEGGDSADKFRRMVEVINIQLESDASGIIEFDSEGGVHVIPT